MHWTQKRVRSFGPSIPKVPRARVRTICCDVVNRGVALYNDKVYLGTLDGRLIALNAKSGKPVWDVITVDQSKPYAITGAPRIANGKVLIGNAGSEFGVRGYISAYDAETGKLLWRTFTVPGDPAKGFESKAMEAAAKTWHGQWWVAGGGGTPWDSIVYDPDLDLVYTGTGNGIAWFRDLRSPGGGDNLYLASILALRASDGELVWHYQVTPGDNWDYDATQPLMLADLPIAAVRAKSSCRPRRMVSSTCSIARPASSSLQKRSSMASLGPRESILRLGARRNRRALTMAGRPYLFPHRLVADITGTPWRFIPRLAWSTSRQEKTRSSLVLRTKTGSRTPRFGIAVRMPPTMDQSRKKHSLLRP